METLHTPPSITKWPARLALDTAMMLELDEKNGLQDLLQRYGIEAIDYATLAKDKVFMSQVESFRSEIRDKGVTFKMKARAQAEELLTTSWMLIHHPDVSPAVKADLIKSTVKWGGLEPKNDSPVDTAGGGVAITINLGDKTVSAVQSTAPVIDMEE